MSLLKSLLAQQVEEDQDEIDRLAHEIAATGKTGRNNELHPCWHMTSSLKHSISRIVCLQLAGNRTKH